jgi:hypothetical protein
VSEVAGGWGRWAELVGAVLVCSGERGHLRGRHSGAGTEQLELAPIANSEVEQEGTPVAVEHRRTDKRVGRSPTARERDADRLRIMGDRSGKQIALRSSVAACTLGVEADRRARGRYAPRLS